MRVEAQAPIIGSSFVGGAAQSYLIRKYPNYSWLLSLGMIAGGAYLGTRSGWQESIGIGIASSGASGLGTALMPVGGENGTSVKVGSGMASRQLAAANIQRRALGAGSRYPADVRESEFSTVRLT